MKNNKNNRGLSNRLTNQEKRCSKGLHQSKETFNGLVCIYCKTNVKLVVKK